jgi:hypothetical protein
MKRISLLAASLLVVGLLAGCGSDGGSAASGSPKDATVDEFCQPFVDMISDITTKGANMSDTDAVKLAKDLADKLAKVGTPKDMPADARKGFELVIKKLQALPDDATKEEVDKAQNLTTEEKKYSDALGQYITTNCADKLLPSGAASPSAS